jgi:hypothetical protein
VSCHFTAGSQCLNGSQYIVTKLAEAPLPPTSVPPQGQVLVTLWHLAFCTWWGPSCSIA